MKNLDTTSQDKIVLWHMTKHKYITSFEAFSYWWEDNSMERN